MFWFRVTFDLVQIDIYTPFNALLQRLWQLWEMVMLAEPLLVLAPSPGLYRAALSTHAMCDLFVAGHTAQLYLTLAMLF